MKDTLSGVSVSSESHELLERLEEAEDGGSMMTFPLSRSQWAKTKGLEPMPRVLPDCFTSHSSSFWSWSLRAFSPCVDIVSARIHFCITVHMFGVGLPGVSLSIASIDAVRLLRDLVGECPAACPAICPFARLPLVGDSELIL